MTIAASVRLGIDFDNTIICYDAVFRAEALQQGLIPPALSGGKGAIRDYLRGQGQEDLWTELQGYVYGKAIVKAEPFPDSRDFLRAMKAAGAAVFLVSHKTRQPYRGPVYDLHTAAWKWLEEQGFFEDCLDPADIFFELTKADKLSRIGSLGLSYFIDDLPEFLAEPDFPEGVQRILFDPGKTLQGPQPLWVAASFPEIAVLLASGRKRAQEACR
jgi:hypothetical protein